MRALEIKIAGYTAPYRLSASPLHYHPNHLVEHRVSFRGLYFFNLFNLSGRFIGSVEISGHPETHNGRIQHLKLNARTVGFNGFGRDFLWFFEQPETIRHPVRLLNEWEVSIFSRPFFREVVIMVHSNGASFYNGSPLIVLRAASQQDAFECALQVHQTAIIDLESADNNFAHRFSADFSPLLLTLSLCAFGHTASVAPKIGKKSTRKSSH